MQTAAVIIVSCNWLTPGSLRRKKGSDEIGWRVVELVEIGWLCRKQKQCWVEVIVWGKVPRGFPEETQLEV